MIRITYSEYADNDLSEIRHHYSSISEQTYDKVLKDITAALEILIFYPEAGYIHNLQRRRLVTPKYRFTISYIFDGAEIEILGIYRFQDR